MSAAYEKPEGATQWWGNAGVYERNRRLCEEHADESRAAGLPDQAWHWHSLAENWRVSRDAEQRREEMWRLNRRAHRRAL